MAHPMETAGVLSVESMSPTQIFFPTKYLLKRRKCGWHNSWRAKRSNHKELSTSNRKMQDGPTLNYNVKRTSVSDTVKAQINIHFHVRIIFSLFSFQIIFFN